MEPPRARTTRTGATRAGVDKGWSHQGWSHQGWSHQGWSQQGLEPPGLEPAHSQPIPPHSHFPFCPGALLRSGSPLAAPKLPFTIAPSPACGCPQGCLTSPFPLLPHHFGSGVANFALAARSQAQFQFLFPWPWGGKEGRVHPAAVPQWEDAHLRGSQAESCTREAHQEANFIPL